MYYQFFITLAVLGILFLLTHNWRNRNGRSTRRAIYRTYVHYGSDAARKHLRQMVRNDWQTVFIFGIVMIVFAATSDGNLFYIAVMTAAFLFYMYKAWKDSQLKKEIDEWDKNYNTHDEE